ncbi:hypothetical protein GCM10009592_28830 [Brachybacterium rhamnosum]|uniref:Ig-like domain-containing protein n=1 Tax=Brachybacterium rhamnosum TaxID=173361 RepID=A0ABW4Q1L8_9MICO
MVWSKKRSSSTGVVSAVPLLAHLTSASFNISIMRTGDAVELSCYVRQFDRAGVAQGGTLLTLPVGWRPAMPYRAYAVVPSTAQLDVATSGVVTVIAGSIAQNSYVTIHLAHLTRDAWPTGGGL